MFQPYSLSSYALTCALLVFASVLVLGTRYRKRQKASFCPGRPFFQSVENSTFAATPLVLTPFVRNQEARASRRHADLPFLFEVGQNLWYRGLTTVAPPTITKQEQHVCSFKQTVIVILWQYIYIYIHVCICLTKVFLEFVGEIVAKSPYLKSSTGRQPGDEETLV